MRWRSQKEKRKRDTNATLYALETYKGYRLRTILLERILSPADMSRRTRGEVSASTIKNMTHSSRPTIRDGTIRARASALSMSVEDRRGEEG